MRIYEYDEQIAEAFDRAIDPETGEVIDENALDWLRQLQMGRDQKIESLLLYWKDLVSDAEEIKAEEQALAGRRKQKERKAESLKGFLQNYLNGEKFETARVAVGYRKSDAVDVFIPPEKLPDKYQRVNVDVKPDKIAIREALKAGEVIEGARLVPNVSMSIK